MQTNFNAKTQRRKDAPRIWLRARAETRKALRGASQFLLNWFALILTFSPRRRKSRRTFVGLSVKLLSIQLQPKFPKSANHSPSPGGESRREVDLQHVSCYRCARFGLPLRPRVFALKSI
jgi:hypothetical protein